MFKVNDFFCGVGGFGLGFLNSGFNLVGAWDIDKYAIQSYRENVGTHAFQMDIRSMRWKDIPEANVWTFGFPCQDLSVAGKRAGLIAGETRSGLFFEIMRLLEETEKNESSSLPEIILAENVKGLKPYLSILEEEYSKRGYDMHYALLNSKYFGVPQNRERYFIIGIRKDLSGQSFSFPKQTRPIPKLSTVLETEVDEKYYINEEQAQKIIVQSRERIASLGSVHATLTPSRIEKRQNGRRAKEEEEEMFTLTAQDLHGIIEQDKRSLSNHRLRKLTPRECARLQGFPDSFKFVVKETNLYKQFGNAVTVNVATEIAKNIYSFLDKLKE